jgi:hypothetical protein
MPDTKSRSWLKSHQMNTLQIPSFYQGYFNQVGSRNPLELMRENGAINEAYFRSLPSEKWDYAYAPGKWTVKELLGHIIDSERVFQYRALRFSRNDKTPLPGFDQDLFVAAGNALRRSPESLMNEYVSVRNASLTLFENLSEEELARTGTANNYEVKTEWIAYMITGHEMHHIQILKERY